MYLCVHAGEYVGKIVFDMTKRSDEQNGVLLECLSKAQT